MSAALELALRLRGRAENATRNAEKLAEMGYRAEALLWEARAAAYVVAAEDAEALCPASQRTPAGAVVRRVEAL